MTQNENQKFILSLDANHIHGYSMSKFIRIGGLKFSFTQKYSRNSSTICSVEVDFEYPKGLCQLHNDYCLARGKKDIKQ